MRYSDVKPGSSGQAVSSQEAKSSEEAANHPITVTHWGAYRVVLEDSKPKRLIPLETDPAPSPIGEALLETREGPCRIASPMVRRGFLEKGKDADRSLRGREGFVEVSWDTALDLVAQELNRVRDGFGNDSIFAGSYGWASAGRFHHAQSQLRRFMNLFGGSTTSRNSYSYAAAEVILPHVVGEMRDLLIEHTSWKSIAESGGLVIAFGGMAARNAQVNAGGTGRHSQAEDALCAKRAGVEFVNVSPSAGDIAPELEADWLPIRPNTDVALMLALAFCLVRDGLYDKEFLERYCVGFSKFLPYLLGQSDGVPKDSSWAEDITGVPAGVTETLARRIASVPTMLTVSWSLTRQQNGEQPYWMAVTLAAMLGGIGRAGTGFGLGLGAVNGVGIHRAHLPWAALPTGRNPVKSFIPVARIADMLIHPGEAFQYNGKIYEYPDIRLVYWAGGNPFHHHQDLNRLRRAWQNIETVVVHEPFWTPIARNADIVLPTSLSMERNDLAGSPRDSFFMAMQKIAEPYCESRSDHDILAGLASRLSSGVDVDGNLESAFTEGRSEDEWLEELYRETKQRGEALGYDLPDYETLVKRGFIELPAPSEACVMLQAFREDPERNPLPTPSGRIEIFSESLAALCLNDNPGHPHWRAPAEWLGAEMTLEFPLHLITHQPARRLHSQLDHSSFSRKGKVKDREPCRLHPRDAARRGIADGDLIRLFNKRGACISAAMLDPQLMPGVVMMATGAWYDPDWEDTANCCKHGNPNTLTCDLPTSTLAQGPGAQTCLVQVQRLENNAPPVTAFEPPEIETS